MTSLLTRFAATIAFVTVSAVAWSQVQGDVYRMYTGGKVMNNTDEMTMAWCGGVNNPQLAMADLNRDGRNDLVIFEESRFNLRTFLSVAPGVYRYEPKYEANFPNDIYDYLKLEDFNNDRIPDLVHRGFRGMNVGYGYYSNNNELKFKPEKELTYYYPGSNWIPIYVGNGTIPGVGDVDGDGDLDVISFNGVGSIVKYYRNCRVEDNLPDDSIRICYADECWGKFYQYAERTCTLNHKCSQFFTSCKGCTQPMAKGTHGLNCLTLIDMDTDGDMDIFNGNQSFSDIQFLVNGRAQYGGNDSIVSQDTIWSSNGVPLNLPLYPAAFHMNIDNSGAKDLVFTPLAAGSENYNSIVLYENTSQTGINNFVYKTDHYLMDGMIDLGSGSYPVFYDYDKDGKDDLFVGSEGYYQQQGNYNKSRISYFRNVSTGIGNFDFELITDDFLNLSTLDWRGAALAIGDIDNDTLDDLIIGRTDGTFAFFKNMAANKSVQPDWQLTIDTLKDVLTSDALDVGAYATPCLYDIDADGKKDLVSGNQKGDLYYIRNNSSASGQIAFEKKTQKLGGISLVDREVPYIYTAPYIGTIDDTGMDYLMLGNYYGRIYRYTGFQNGAMPLQYTRLDSIYSYIQKGQRTTPAFANLDNDLQGLHELIVGNLLGGLSFYKQDYRVNIRNVSTTSDNNIQVYPNPAKDALNVNWSKEFNNGGVTVHLMNITGQLIAEQHTGNLSESCSIDLSNIASGVYYCILHSGGNKVIKSVSVLK